MSMNSFMYEKKSHSSSPQKHRIIPAMKRSIMPTQLKSTRNHESVITVEAPRRRIPAPYGRKLLRQDISSLPKKRYAIPTVMAV